MVGQACRAPAASTRVAQGTSTDAGCGSRQALSGPQPLPSRGVGCIYDKLSCVCSDPL
jgi:hypothetical protein